MSYKVSMFFEHNIHFNKEKNIHTLQVRNGFRNQGTFTVGSLKLE